MMGQIYEPRIWTRFSPGVRGVILRKSTKAHKHTTYKTFLSLLQKLTSNGLKIDIETGSSKGPKYVMDGKRIDFSDSLVFAYVYLGHTKVDEITFYTVKKITNRDKETYVAPNMKNSENYLRYKKEYKNRWH